MIGVSRRTALYTLGGGIALLGAGYAAVRSFEDEDLVRLRLRRYLGPVEMADDDVRAFTLEFKKRNASSFPTENLADFAILSEQLGMAHAARLVLPGDRAQRLELFDRWLLADFHLLTDYPQRQSPAEPVHFAGARLCTNPFAKFDAA